GGYVQYPGGVVRTAECGVCSGHGEPHFNGCLTLTDTFKLLSLGCCENGQRNRLTSQPVCRVHRCQVAPFVIPGAGVEVAQPTGELAQDCSHGSLHHVVLLVQHRYGGLHARVAALQGYERHYAACAEQQRGGGEPNDNVCAYGLENGHEAPTRVTS